MADLEQQVHDYATGLDLGAPIDPEEIVREADRLGPDRGGHRAAFLVAAAVLVVVVLGAAVLALRNGDDRTPTPPAGPTVIPQAWNRVATIDGAQPSAMAASDHGVVIAGYGTWWSADGSTWQAGTVDGLDGPNPVQPGSIADVIPTPDGYLAVGAGGDKQPAIWRSADGRSWTRVTDPDLTIPTGAIPSTVSTTYGSIAAVTATGDGFVAVGQVFDGTFVGDTLMPSPFRPAVWTSTDGSDWTTASSLPDDRGGLVGVAATSDGVVAVGIESPRSFVWRLGAADWEKVGEFDGAAGSIASVGDRLVAAGTTGGDRTQTPTIWSSSDGRSWTTAHQEPAASLGTFSALESDGDAVLAVGYSGPGELDVHSVMVSSTDGSTWTPVPGPTQSPVSCALTGTATCPAISSYPIAAALADGDLLLAMQEQVTNGPNEQDRSVTRLQTGIYRSSASPPSDPADAAPLRARLELPSTTLAAGASMAGEVVVDNDTGIPVDVGSCQTIYGASLRGDSYQQGGARLDCLQNFVLPVGESRWPIVVSGTVSACLMADGQGDAPRCLEGNVPPPIPTGTYQLVIDAPEGAPIPDPVTIQVQ